MEDFLLDKSYWKVDDRNWLQERKVQWGVIAKKLESTKTRKGITVIKQYFLKGKMPDWVKMEDWGDAQGHVDVFMLLWLHPSWDAALLRGLRDQYLAFPGVRLDDVDYGYKKFISSASIASCHDYSSAYLNHEDIPWVDTGGHNELLFDVLMDDYCREQIELARVEFEARVHPVFHFPKPDLGALISMGKWLCVKRMFPINEDMLYQYDAPLEWWYHGCAQDRNFLNGPQLEAKLENLTRALCRIYYFSYDAEGDSPRSRFVTKMRAMLNERPFIKEIEEIWLGIKRGEITEPL